MELGIRVENGCIRIEPAMLSRDEFKDGKLSFTYCGVNFVYELSQTNEGTVLDAETSRHIFARDGQVTSLHVKLAL